MDWWDDLLGDRDPGLSTGELEGVIFRDAPGPASLLFALRGAVVAMVGWYLSPLSGVFACQSDAFVGAQWRLGGRRKREWRGTRKEVWGDEINERLIESLTSYQAKFW
jgi:hypothetical protein